MTKFSHFALSLNLHTGGCGAMYEIFVESEDFRGKRQVQQHRLVNKVSIDFQFVVIFYNSKTLKLHKFENHFISCLLNLLMLLIRYNPIYIS